MMEITININCPALDRLADALRPRELTISAPVRNEPSTRPDPIPVTPTTPASAPVPITPSAPIAPVNQMPQAPIAPISPMPTGPSAPPIMPAPTSEPDYTHEQLGRAAATYMDQAPVNQGRLIQLLQTMGVQAITQLVTREQRAAFANGLRGLGAQV